MSRRARLSLDPGTPLSACSRSNRRTSFGGVGSDSPSEKKDRRAMLDEWRKSRGSAAAAAAAASPARGRPSTAPGCDDEETAAAPPVSAAFKSDEKENEGMSALEKYRLRKQQEANDPSSTPVAATPTRGRAFQFEDEETTTIGLGGTPNRRPKAGRRSLSCGGARKVRRRTSLTPGEASLPPPLPDRKHNKPMLPPSYPSSAASSAASSAEQNEAAPHDEVVVAPNSQESADSIDSVAMRSRINVMQKQIDRLEREKMELIRSKAPLEARIRQKEDAFVKERERLVLEIEGLQKEGREADERYRELEMKNEELNEEMKKMMRQANEAKSQFSQEESGQSDAWGERLRANKENAALRAEIKNKDEEIKNLRMANVSLEAEVKAYSGQIETLEKNYDDLERDYADLEASKSKNSEAEIQLEALTAELVATTSQLNATSQDFEEIKFRSKADLAAKEEKWKSRESELLFEISVLKSRAGKETAADVTLGEEDAAILNARIEARDRRIAELEEQLLNGEQLRRALHNRIQELRGNIRVYVRTRPFLPNDGVSAAAAAGGGLSSIDILPDGESLTIQGRKGENAHAFKFDKVFAPSAGQDIVFDEVSEFVQSALDGYHVCLFSYGQTGSGKTHTMQGSGNGAMRGIIPRAVEQILAQAATMQTQRWTFTMKASFLEIYNEELRDLLVMMNSDGSIKPRDARSANKLSIKRNAEGKSYVDGINMVDIDVENTSTGLEQLEAVIAAAARARSVAKTNMNSQSSRSHSVFMLHLCGTNEESGTVVQGALNLCDLAGSERLDRSGASSNAQRLKETQAINKSLSCLGDVFTALSNGSKHIPFRNSKLTYLLQDCLSGDGKALMFVNLSPTLESSSESLCSLRFAQRVNQVELGKATKHVQYSK